MAVLLIPGVDPEFRRRHGLADDDAGPWSLPNPRFVPNQARDAKQLRHGRSAPVDAADSQALSAKRAGIGQHVANGAGLAVGAVNSVAKEGLSNGKLLGKVAGEILDGPMAGLSAGLKYKELKALGYSDKAAVAGAAAATATSQAFVRGGSLVGGALGGASSGGALAVPGVVAGGAVGGALDWYLDRSGKAATYTANLIDGRKQ